MAKWSEKAAATEAANEDLLLISQDAGGGSYVSKNIPVEDFIASPDVQAGLGGGGATYSGAESYFMYPDETSGDSGAAIAGNANDVVAHRVFLPYALTVVSIHFYIQTLHAANFAAVGIYSADGATLLIDSGAKSTAATGLQSTTLGSPVTLPAGFYLFAWTQSSTTPRLLAVTNIQTSGVALMNAGQHQRVKGTNQSASGVLPSSLGTLLITGISTTPTPVIKLQG